MHLQMCSHKHGCIYTLVGYIRYTHLNTHMYTYKLVHYGVASVSRIDKIIGLSCKRDL